MRERLFGQCHQEVASLCSRPLAQLPHEGRRAEVVADFDLFACKADGRETIHRRRDFGVQILQKLSVERDKYAPHVVRVKSDAATDHITLLERRGLADTAEVGAEIARAVPREGVLHLTQTLLGLEPLIAEAERELFEGWCGVRWTVIR